jgi:hypothetical protein
MEAIMQAKSRNMLGIAVAAVVAIALVGGVAKWTPLASSAAAVETGRAGISPFEIMLQRDARTLPVEEFKDGECPARC